MRILVLLFAVVMTTFPTAATAGQFWNPFEDQEEEQSFLEDVRDVLRGALAAIEALTGRAVSRFRLPEFGLLGFRPTGSYRPPAVPIAAGFRPPTGFRGLLQAPSPAPSEKPSLGTACGPGDGDAWWAKDCSCNCNDPLCPRPLITIGDRHMTFADCLLHRDPINKDGGSPTGDFHF